jgi:hypothetical protein
VVVRTIPADATTDNQLGQSPRPVNAISIDAAALGAEVQSLPVRLA